MCGLLFRQNQNKSELGRNVCYILKIDYWRPQITTDLMKRFHLRVKNEKKANLFVLRKHLINVIENWAIRAGKMWDKL